MPDEQQSPPIHRDRLGLPTILFVVFLVLRLTDSIDWAWYWVASPLWIPLVFIVVLGALSLLADLLFAAVAR